MRSSEYTHAYIQSIQVMARLDWQIFKQNSAQVIREFFLP